MNNKIIPTILTILSIFFLICGIFGFFLNKNGTDVIINSSKNISYKYYLENEEVNEMPKNTIITNEDGTTTQDIQYIFKKYTCTNDTKIIFNNDSWTFTAEGNNNDTCKLYFSKSNYTVKLILTNAVEDENNSPIIKRETDANFIIIPNEGYIFKNVSCTNNKDAFWNEKTNTLTLNAVMQDTECNVNFDKKQLQVIIVVKNGTGNTTENVLYADNKSIIVNPNEGYKDANVTCTNKQTATFENNTITFDKITNNTTCTVTFKKIKIIYYNLSIEIANELTNITLISEKTQSIKTGEDGKIVLRTLDGSSPKLNCGDIIPTVKELDSNEKTKTIEYMFYNMSNNVSCKISN